jgi:hypothetical protein
MNLRTRAGILQAIWDKIEVEDKNKIVGIDIWFRGKGQLCFLVTDNKLTFDPQWEDLEKVNTMSFLGELYQELPFVDETVVSFSTEVKWCPKKEYKTASWKEETQKLSLF